VFDPAGFCCQSVASPSLRLELIGISYSLWFTYRYLLFKPDREELKVQVNKIKDQILG
jgi:hypothetical protein